MEASGTPLKSPPGFPSDPAHMRDIRRMMRKMYPSRFMEPGSVPEGYDMPRPCEQSTFNISDVTLMDVPESLDSGWWKYSTPTHGADGKRVPYGTRPVWFCSKAHPVTVLIQPGVGVIDFWHDHMHSDEANIKYKGVTIRYRQQLPNGGRVRAGVWRDNTEIESQFPAFLHPQCEAFYLHNF